MPVTQSFTMRAGRSFWGYPKVIAQIDIDLGAHAARASLTQDNDLAFSMRTPLGTSGRFSQRITNLTWLDGTLRRIEARFTGEGTSFTLGGAPRQSAKPIHSHEPCARSASPNAPSRRCRSAAQAHGLSRRPC